MAGDTATGVDLEPLAEQCRVRTPSGRIATVEHDFGDETEIRFDDGEPCRLRRVHLQRLEG